MNYLSITINKSYHPSIATNVPLILSFLLIFILFIPIVSIPHFQHDSPTQVYKFIAELIVVGFLNFKLDWQCNLTRLIFLVASVHERIIGF